MAAEEWFVAEGCGRLTMNMVLTGTDAFARPEFKIARRDECSALFLLPSLEVAGPRCTGSRSPAPLLQRMQSSPTTPSECSRRIRVPRGRTEAMRPGTSCHDVHRAVSSGFTERGYHSATSRAPDRDDDDRVPKVGEGVETELAENMVFPMHPHAIAANGEDCLYMQDTWLVTDGGGVLANLPMQVFRTNS